MNLIFGKKYVHIKNVVPSVLPTSKKLFGAKNGKKSQTCHILQEMCQPLKEAIQFSKVGENKYRKYIEHVASIGLEKCKIHKGSNGYFMLQSPESKKKKLRNISRKVFFCLTCKGYHTTRQSLFNFLSLWRLSPILRQIQHNRLFKQLASPLRGNTIPLFIHIFVIILYEDS